MPRSCIPNEAGPSRRQVLRACAGAAGMAVARPGRRRGDAEDLLDRALADLQSFEPRCRHGLSTHAPMAAEALAALDSAERIAPWIESYGGPARELPQPAAAIAAEHWRAALGPDRQASSWEAQNPRYGDWVRFFQGQLSAGPWREVLDLWAGRLAPGLSGAATHGLIRTGHAARALARRDNAVRRGELARGLAYWASSYEEIPARAPQHQVADYAAALALVPTYWQAYGRDPKGPNIVAGLRDAARLDGLAAAKDLVPVPAEPAAALSELTALFARIYLEQGRERHTIAFVHAVTAPCALRKLLPHLRPETARAALPYAWQAAAAVYAAYARPGAPLEPPRPGAAPAQLAAAAAHHEADHAIKFTEAVLAEYALRPDSVYLAAAADVLERL